MKARYFTPEFCGVFFSLPYVNFPPNFQLNTPDIIRGGPEEQIRNVCNPRGALINRIGLDMLQIIFQFTSLKRRFALPHNPPHRDNFFLFPTYEGTNAVRAAISDLRTPNYAILSSYLFRYFTATPSIAIPGHVAHSKTHASQAPQPPT